MHFQNSRSRYLPCKASTPSTTSSVPLHWYINKCSLWVGMTKALVQCICKPIQTWTGHNTLDPSPWSTHTPQRSLTLTQWIRHGCLHPVWVWWGKFRLFWTAATPLLFDVRSWWTNGIPPSVVTCTRSLPGRKSLRGCKRRIRRMNRLCERNGFLQAEDE